MNQKKIQRTRTEQIKFWATPEEKDLILKKMALAQIMNMGSYLRKMAIDGYVIKLDLPELKELLRLMNITSSNVNQIVRRFNATNQLYEADIQEVCTRMDAIYEELRRLLINLSKIK